MERFFFWFKPQPTSSPPPPPKKITSLEIPVHQFIKHFELLHPSPLGTSNDLPWGGSRNHTFTVLSVQCHLRHKLHNFLLYMYLAATLNTQIQHENQNYLNGQQLILHEILFMYLHDLLYQFLVTHYFIIA